MGRIRAHGADITVGDLVIHVRMLPPNTTCELQPADQALISSMKAQWRSHLDEVSRSIENSRSAAGFASGISVMDVMKFLSGRARTIVPAVGQRYWSRLLRRGIATDQATEEESTPTQAEALVAGREGMWNA
jgi:hypothetical protein